MVVSRNGFQMSDVDSLPLPSPFLLALFSRLYLPPTAIVFTLFFSIHSLHLNPEASKHGLMKSLG